MKVIILKGLPASGKSTWARDFCEKNTDYVRINRDDLRNMRGKYWLPKDEDMITDMEQSCITAAIDHGKSIVLDSTNLNPKYVENVQRLIMSHVDRQIEVEFKGFHVSPEECIKRDAKRGKDSVGADVIWDMYYRYIAPIPVYKEDTSLPRAIIVDIDGTLAHNNGGRSPYDWKRVGEDTVDRVIARLVNMYDETHHIIVLSGRDSVCREETKEWLRKNSVIYDDLHMRKQGDSRKDSIIKKELFENYIRGKYYVDLVIDDRDQVVRMWRNELGLKCLQVQYGNF
jgi:predicted kinase